MLVEPGTAETFRIVVCKPLDGIEGLATIRTQLEWTGERLDHLMIRHAKVLIVLAAITSDEWWLPNYCMTN